MAVGPVMPYRAGARDHDPALGIFYRPDAITVLSASWDEAATASHTYYLAEAAGGGFELRHYDGAAGDFPVMDGVGLLRFEYFAFNAAPIDPAALVDGPWFPDAADANRFDTDLLTIRRVRVILRVEPRALFRRRLTGREIRFDVAPRNLTRD